MQGGSWRRRDRILIVASFEEAHAALLRDGAIQFGLGPTVRSEVGQGDRHQPTPAAAAPASALDPTAAVVAMVGTVLLAILVAALLAARRRRPPQAELSGAAPVAVPRTTAAVFAAGLREADALAASSRFLEAARMLLACGLEEVGRRFPGELSPSATSRDIARSQGLPEPVREAFGRIARVVELGLFGGRPVDGGHYARCRDAFVGSSLGRGA